MGSAGPHVRAPGRVAGTPAAPVRFQVSATGSATIKAAGLPQGSVFDTNTGDFEWNPLPADQGEHEISFIATDALGARTVRTVVVYIGTGAPVATQLRNMAGGAVMQPRSDFFGLRLVSIGQRDPAGRPVRPQPQPGRDPCAGEWRVRSILSASAGQVEFLCPTLPAGTPLDIAVETRAGQSGALRTTMEETAPAILTVDGSPQGHALAIQANSDELAALPSFRYRATPASVWRTDLSLGHRHRMCCLPVTALEYGWTVRRRRVHAAAAPNGRRLPDRISCSGRRDRGFRIPQPGSHAERCHSRSKQSDLCHSPALVYGALSNLNLEEKQ